MVKNVIYIEKEKFLRSMLELALKSKVESIYTTDTLVDNFYLLEDLSPDMVIVDYSSIDLDLLNELLNKKAFKIVVTVQESQESEAKSLSNVDLVLVKPLLVNGLVQKLLEL